MYPRLAAANAAACEPALAISLNNLSVRLAEAGRRQEAERAQQRPTAWASTPITRSHPLTLVSRHHFAAPDTDPSTGPPAARELSQDRHAAQQLRAKLCEWRACSLLAGLQ